MVDATPATLEVDPRSFRGMNAVEIKVTVRPDQELLAERSFQVNEDTADVRMIYFYDTADLTLFDSGIALRSRLVKGESDDSTVKFRPADKELISDEWLHLDGFKLEADWVGDKAVCSASLTSRQEHDDIIAVAEGKRGIDKVFTKNQRRFLTEFSSRPIELSELFVMGPIRVLRWKLRREDFAHQICVEEWRLPDGDDLVEVSIKAPPAGALQARRAFDSLLRELKLDPQGAQQTKTRTALEYFAAAYRSGPH